MEIVTDTLMTALIISSPIIIVLGTAICVGIYQNHKKPIKRHWEVK